MHIYISRKQIALAPATTKTILPRERKRKEKLHVRYLG